MKFSVSARTAWGISLFLIVLDQVSKNVILGVFQDTWPPIMPVTDFINLVLVWNYGVSFGLFSGADARYFLIAFTLAVSTLLVYWSRKAQTDLERLGLLTIFAGAVGNVIDRIVHGAVVDFLDFHFFDWHFWAFNFADTAITIGVIMLLVDTVFPARGQETTDS